MIRIIVRTLSGFPDANTNTEHKTFDIDAPEVEKYLREVEKWSFTSRAICGGEVVEQ